MSSPTPNNSTLVEMGGAYTTTDLEIGVDDGYRRRGSSNTERSVPLLTPSSPSNSRSDSSSSNRKQLPPAAIAKLNKIAGQRGGAEAIAEVFKQMGTCTASPQHEGIHRHHQQQQHNQQQEHDTDEQLPAKNEILSFVVPEGRSELIRH